MSRRRGAELFLLVISLIVGVGAYAAVGFGVEGTVPADIVGYGGWLAVLCVGCHIVVRLVAPYADRCCCRSWPRSTASGWR